MRNRALELSTVMVENLQPVLVVVTSGRSDGPSVVANRGYKSCYRGSQPSAVDLPPTHRQQKRQSMQVAAEPAVLLATDMISFLSDVILGDFRIWAVAVARVTYPFA